ncbi:MAG TPA: cupin domain-containing protein [Thermoleophilaceae bacterium]|nr:cupin domain-containing protein [Thermoleophilaceae bacterium]
MSEQVRETIEGDGYAVGHIDGMGEGPGFRKVRQELGVTAFGVNAVVLPPGIEGRRHYHEQQEEVYFVHCGEIELELGDGSTYRLGPGGVARVDAHTVRALRNASDSEEAVYLSAGGAGGYVGRDGRVPEADEPT